MIKLSRVIDQWLGVILTIIILILIQLGNITSFLITPSINLAYIPLAYTTYRHGLYPGLTAAIFIIAYSFIFLSVPIDLNFQIAISVLIIAVLMSILKRQSKVVEEISTNDNIFMAHEISLLVGYLLENRHEMNDGLVYRLLLEIQDRSGNLEAIISGWQKLASMRRKEERLHNQDIIRRIVSDFESEEHIAKT